MIELNPGDCIELPNDKTLSDIVSTHLIFMKQFSTDDDISYSLIIVGCKQELDGLMTQAPDSVNITGNYFEITFIGDNYVKVVIVRKDYANSDIVRYLDESS